MSSRPSFAASSVLEWEVIADALADVRTALGSVRPIDVEIHLHAVALARSHGFSFYDALIVASALEAGCDTLLTLLTEDLQAGRRVDGLSIVNPVRLKRRRFAACRSAAQPRHRAHARPGVQSSLSGNPETANGSSVNPNRASVSARSGWPICSSRSRTAYARQVSTNLCASVLVRPRQRAPRASRSQPGMRSGATKWLRLAFPDHESRPPTCSGAEGMSTAGRSQPDPGVNTGSANAARPLLGRRSRVGNNMATRCDPRRPGPLPSRRE